MAETQIYEPDAHEPSSQPEQESRSTDESAVCDSWQKVVQSVIVLVIFISTLVMVHYYRPAAVGSALPSDDLEKQVHELTAQVDQLKQEQAMPSMVLNHYRNSIGYIYGVYQVGFANKRPGIRARVSGTGFLIGDGVLATNRHVAEPWFGDTDAEKMISEGAKASLETLVIFFPGEPTPVALSPVTVSRTADLALLRAQDPSATRGLAVLPLAKSPGSPGQLVTVIGYPMGIAGMVAKSPAGIYERLAYRHNDISAASELAALSLIRPSTTCGHLGDVVGDKLIYDAPTAHGGSGGPVFNARGEVIGVNSAYMDGFTGGTLGVSVDSLHALLEQAEKQTD